MKKIILMLVMVVLVSVCAGNVAFAGKIVYFPEVVAITDIENNDVFQVVNTFSEKQQIIEKEIYDASRSSWSAETGKISEKFPVDWNKNYDYAWFEDDTTFVDGYRLVTHHYSQRFVDIDGDPVKIAKGYGMDPVLMNHVDYYEFEEYCTFGGRFFHYTGGYLFMSEKNQNHVAYTSLYNVVDNKLYYFPIVYRIEGRTDGPYERYHMTAFNDSGYAYVYKTKVWPGGLPGNVVYDTTVYHVRVKNSPVVRVKYNGEKIGFDQIPVIESGRTLVPLRAIFEKFGAEVSWNDKTKTVSAVKGDTIIALTVNEKTALINGEEVELDVPAKIVNGRTMVPVRFISDCFGVNVDWNADERCVYLEDLKD